MPEPFKLQANVHANVKELRRALGSATRPLSAADLARMLNDRDPGRKRAVATVQRWEERVEPDIMSGRLMAELAGVTFEQFMLGTGKRARRATQSAGGIAVSSADYREKKKGA